jgi:hypothetical protein
MKTCSKCHEELPVERFQRHATTADGRRPECHACGAAYSKAYREAHREQTAATARRYRTRNRERRNAYSLAWAKAHPERAKRTQRRHLLKKYYGLSERDYDAMVASQGGLCGLCRRPPGKRGLAVDHDHSTGRVRALLCDSCNVALGLMRDDPALLRAAANYIEAHR